MGNTDLVQSPYETSSGCSNYSAKDKTSLDFTAFRTESPISRQTCADSLSCIRSVFTSRGLSTKATDIIMSSWRSSTKKGYKTYVQKWIQYCCEKQIDKFSPSVNEVIEFLTDLFENGLGYSSINIARSALSSIGIKL